MKINNKVIVVTGGGSGIGRSLVLDLVKRGAKVAAVDRNEATLEQTVALAGTQRDIISTHLVNISDRKAVEALPASVIEAHGAVDGLINNAGIIQPFMKFNDLEFDAIERVINVNLYGVIYMTKAFLPHLLNRPEAHLVNVSSMGGFFPFPGQTLYGASKAAVKLLTEGLYSELLETNVHVTVVFPGAIATNISQNSGVEMPVSADDAAASSIQMTTPEKAAETIINGMEKDKFQVYIGNDAKLMNMIYKIAPKRATRFIQRRMKGMIES
jgi:short-subunit dehydrogenase